MRILIFTVLLISMPSTYGSQSEQKVCGILEMENGLMVFWNEWPVFVRDDPFDQKSTKVNFSEELTFHPTRHVSEVISFSKNTSEIVLTIKTNMFVDGVQSSSEKSVVIDTDLKEPVNCYGTLYDN